MGVYTLISLLDQSSAIESLPAPPGAKGKGKGNAKAEKATATECGLDQLDVIWGDLPESIKATILNLAMRRSVNLIWAQ